jgi:hypothetical protein
MFSASSSLRRFRCQQYRLAVGLVVDSSPVRLRRFNYGVHGCHLAGLTGKSLSSQTRRWKRLRRRSSGAVVNESDHVDWKRRSSLKCVNNTIVVRFGKFSAAVEKGRCYVCEMLPPCRHCGHYCMGWASVRDDGPNELCLAYQVVRRATAAMQLAEIAGGPETEVTQEWLRYATQTAATMAKIAAREAQENRIAGLIASARRGTPCLHQTNCAGRTGM